MATTRKDVAAVTEPVTAAADQPVTAAADQPSGVPDVAKAKEARPFISEGVRQDLEIHGKAVDPVTGNTLELNGDKVTVTDRRTGETTDVPL